MVDEARVHGPVLDGYVSRITEALRRLLQVLDVGLFRLALCGHVVGKVVVEDARVAQALLQRDEARARVLVRECGHVAYATLRDVGHGTREKKKAGRRRRRAWFASIHDGRLYQAVHLWDRV